jgi:hypothetical protein
MHRQWIRSILRQQIAPRSAASANNDSARGGTDAARRAT